MLISLIERRRGLAGSEDFAGHQRYLSHRLKKLRRYENLVSRAGKTYNPPPLQPTVKHALVALLQAERCWAAAHVAKNALHDFGTAKSASSLQKTVVSKLAKAEKHAREFCVLSAQNLEAQTYHAFLTAELAIERQRWSEAAVESAKAYLGFWALSPKIDGALLNSEREYEPFGLMALFSIALAKTRASEGRARFSIAQELVREQCAPFAELVASHRAYTPPVAANQPRTVRFRRFVAPIRHERLILALETLERHCTAELATKEVLKLSPAQTKTQISAWDAQILRWDALLLQAESIAAELREQSGVSDEDLENIDVVSAYAKFNGLCRRIQRDATLAQSLDAPKEAVRLYELPEQTCDELQSVPGVGNDDELFAGISAMREFFRAQRAAVLAETYATGTRERLALFAHAQKLLTNLKVDPRLELPITSQIVVESFGSVRQQTSLAYAHWFLRQTVLDRSKMLGSFASNVDFKQLVPKNETLAIADWAGRKLDAAPVKPVFYDIAYNHLNPVEHEMEVEVVEEPVKRKLFGLF